KSGLGYPAPPLVRASAPPPQPFQWSRPLRPSRVRAARALTEAEGGGWSLSAPAARRSPAAGPGKRGRRGRPGRGRPRGAPAEGACLGSRTRLSGPPGPRSERRRGPRGETPSSAPRRPRPGSRPSSRARGSPGPRPRSREGCGRRERERDREGCGRRRRGNRRPRLPAGASRGAAACGHSRVRTWRFIFLFALNSSQVLPSPPQSHAAPAGQGPPPGEEPALAELKPSAPQTALSSPSRLQGLPTVGPRAHSVRSISKTAQRSGPSLPALCLTSASCPAAHCWVWSLFACIPFFLLSFACCRCHLL
ncbi:PREDICTED: collagen alpha-1(I) chain-like, partial [Chinchilla lanigera]|uniref:collagen alpha-1(I) chain-like n=1 Tax=Chinchilla lanigera TaxID=34839 RepID=UPI0006984BB2